MREAEHIYHEHHDYHLAVSSYLANSVDLVHECTDFLGGSSIETADTLARLRVLARLLILFLKNSVKFSMLLSQNRLWQIAPNIYFAINRENPAAQNKPSNKNYVK